PDTVATATVRGADVDWYGKAADLVLKGQTKPHQKYKKEASESEK
ncbi:conjugal transfer protein, partial [Streptococcus agalactiae]|nr:conjugal transfer protein [Streptococcus agalactiae]